MRCRSSIIEDRSRQKNSFLMGVNLFVTHLQFPSISEIFSSQRPQVYCFVPLLALFRSGCLNYGLLLKMSPRRFLFLIFTTINEQFLLKPPSLAWHSEDSSNSLQLCCQQRISIVPLYRSCVKFNRRVVCVAHFTQSTPSLRAPKNWVFLQIEKDYELN